MTSHVTSLSMVSLDSSGSKHTQNWTPPHPSHYSLPFRGKFLDLNIFLGSVCILMCVYDPLSDMGAGSPTASGIGDLRNSSNHFRFQLSTSEVLLKVLPDANSLSRIIFLITIFNVSFFFTLNLGITTHFHLHLLHW